MGGCASIRSSIPVGVVAAALPGDRTAKAVLDLAAKKKEDEERNAEDGKSGVERREVCPGDAAVEAKGCAQPEQKDGSPLPEDEVRKTEGEWGESEEEKQIEQAPHGQKDGPRHEQSKVLGPAFDEIGGGAIHAGGEGLGGIAEADRCGRRV